MRFMSVLQSPPTKFRRCLLLSVQQRLAPSKSRFQTDLCSAFIASGIGYLGKIEKTRFLRRRTWNTQKIVKILQPE